ncbi:hypothetical protein KKE28_01185, partial [Patescibacteria group bacterium]|nr:hypothetical protein [Patescibacteria group bacterium]
MESGIISNLIDYYRDHPRYSKENLWAWREFFGGGYRPTDLEMGWFVEWYLFEFRLKNGNSVLEEHVQNNPWRESEQMLNLYRNLADAKFGLYEVLRVDLGEGLRLRNVQNAEEVEVKECSATYQTKDGMLVLARIAQVGDHNEIVGSDTPMLDTRIGSGLRDYLRQTTDTLTMRNILQMSQDAASSSELGESALNETLYNEMSRAIDPAKTKNNFTVALRDLELERLVDVGKVQEWIERSTFEDSFTPLAMLLGLVSSDIELKKLNRLIEVMNDFMNVTPRESLGGKSPQEMVQSNPDHQSDIMTDQMLFGINCCGDEMDEAFGYMQNRQFRKSARVYCKVFEQLLKHRTTLYEIYRLYANKAT